jgi:hypothetical protein
LCLSRLIYSETLLGNCVHLLTYKGTIFVETSCSVFRAFERQEDGTVPCSSSSTLHDVLQSLTVYNMI